MCTAVKRLLLVTVALLLGPAALRAQPLPAGAEPVVMLERPDVKGPPAAGVLLSADGLVLTSSTVVGRNKRLTAFVSATDRRGAALVALDEDAGLALLNVGAVPGQKTLPLYAGRPLEKGSVLTVRGLEAGLPWQQSTATVIGTQTGPWGNLAPGFLTLDGANDGTGADVGAAVLAADGSLAGVHLGRTRVEGAPAPRFVTAGVDRIRAFLRVATAGMPVARFCVVSSVAGTTVWVDGKEQGRAPAAITGFVAGWHTVRVASEGHAPQERVILAGLEEGPCQTFELKPSPSVVFRAAVAGLSVSVDGSPYSALPPGPLHLPEGPHTVRVMAQGFRAQTWEGALRDGDALSVDLTLIKQHGTLSVQTVPEGAHVFVEGRDAGAAPIRELKLAPGRWRVEIRAPHHRPLELGSVVITDGTATDLGEQKLAPLPARLALAPGVTEDGDEVYLNGQRVSGTSWKVAPGYHEVVVRRSWHTPGKLRVFMEPEEQKNVAPRPELLPEARTRRLKLGLGTLAVVGGVGAVGTGVLLLGGGVLALVGMKLTYDRYLVATQQQQWTNLYWLSNGLLWGGVSALAVSALAVVGSVGAVAAAVYAFFTLPSDPSRKPEATRKMTRAAPFPCTGVRAARSNPPPACEKGA